MPDDQNKGLPLLQDAQAQSTDPQLPAFLAPPPDAPAYYGFPLVPETETEGWMYGAITGFEDPQGCTSGDGYVQAPDGSRAGLVWGPDEEHMQEYLSPAEDRWGVYAIRFPHPVRTVEDLTENFRAVLPDLQRRYAQVEAAKRLVQEFGIPYVDLARITPEPEVLALVPHTLAVEYNVLPLRKHDGRLFFATAAPGNMQACDAIRRASRCTIMPVLTLAEDIRAAIVRYYPNDAPLHSAALTASGAKPEMNAQEGEIKFFYEWKAYGCFSNYARVGFEENGIWWLSSEHYYHLQKFSYPPASVGEGDTLHDLQKAIYQAPTPGDAQQIARKNAHMVRSDWEQIKDDVMRRAVLRKFQCNPALADVLLGTGDAILIENSKKDAHFGVGPDGKGLNMLGKILMETREFLRQCGAE